MIRDLRFVHKITLRRAKNQFSVGAMMATRIFLLTFLLTSSAALQTVLPFSRHSLVGTRRTPLLFSSNEREVLLAKKLEAKAALDRLDALEGTIQALNDKSLTDASANIDAVEKDIEKLALALLPPTGMAIGDYQRNVLYFCSLPFSMQLALIQLVELPDDTILDVTKYPTVIDLIYQQGRTLTPQRLEDALKSVQRNISTTSSNRQKSDMARDTKSETERIVGELLDGKSVDDVRFENLVKQHLGRTTRKEGKSVTQKDLETFLSTLEDKSIFVARGKPEAIPGGYLIRGQPKKKTGKDIVEALDAKLPTNWGAQVSYMPDFTMEPDIENPVAEPVLVLLNNDFAPETSVWLLTLSTGAAIVSCFLFGVGVYGSNDAVTIHLTDLNAVADTSGLNWFNGLLIQVLVPIAVIQSLHELGHLLIAWKENIKTTPPTLLPFWILPFMGAQTQLKTSPKNLTTLFDFAFLGPFMGIVSSLIFLVVGVQLTLIADNETSMYFPALPVNFLRMSTLGSTILDTMFGGNGYVTSQADTANIMLHPLAIGGFTGLLINSLALLPLGSSDGGRMSQALFSRNGHLLVGGATWFSLLLTTLALDQHDVLLGAWVVYNIAQNDQEVPCRDEVDKVNIWRAVAGFGLWFVAVLTLVPLDHTLV